MSSSRLSSYWAHLAHLLSMSTSQCPTPLASAATRVGRGFSGTQIYEKVCTQQRATGGLWEDPEVLYYYSMANPYLQYGIIVRLLLYVKHLWSAVSGGLRERRRARRQTQRRGLETTEGVLSHTESMYCTMSEATALRTILYT